MGCLNFGVSVSVGAGNFFSRACNAGGDKEKRIWCWMWEGERVWFRLMGERFVVGGEAF